MINKEVYDKVVAEFAAKFGGAPAAVAYAPGRIEVLGNHTDYNEGYVFSAAIDKGTFFAVSPAADDKVTLVALDMGETYETTLGAVAKVESGATWANYPLGTFNWLFDGEPAKAGKGFSAVFGGNIPLGAGLSSSAALEMSTVLALAKIYGIEKDYTTLAKIGQKAEHTFAGCPCGLLDQASSLYGKEGALVKSDFRTCEFENVPMV
ncbi:MAG: galactokinase, partial [Kiritimatiellae bacterium]|nr:galactokinase [Kiritimatiellia bacterium]